MKNQSSAHVLFHPQTPVSLTDSYKTVDIVINIPRQLNVELQKVFQFTTVLQELEKESSKLCNNQELNLLLQHHFDDLISSIKAVFGKAERRRNQITDEVKIFTNQTDLIQLQRLSLLLFAMGALTAITLIEIVRKNRLQTSLSAKVLTVFGHCHSSKQKMKQLEERHNVES